MNNNPKKVKIARCCANCEFSFTEKDKLLYCRRYPPAPMAMPSVNPISQKPQVALVSVPAQVPKEYLCGEHMWKVSLTDAASTCAVKIDS